MPVRWWRRFPKARLARQQELVPRRRASTSQTGERPSKGGNAPTADLAHGLHFYGEPDEVWEDEFGHQSQRSEEDLPVAQVFDHEPIEESADDGTGDRTRPQGGLPVCRDFVAGVSFVWLAGLLLKRWKAQG